MTVLTSSTVAVLASHQFSDVATGSWVHPAVSHIAAAGCATGYSDGTFQPDENPSRAQFAFCVSNCGGRADFAVANGDFVTNGDTDPAFGRGGRRGRGIEPRPRGLGLRRRDRAEGLREGPGRLRGGLVEGQ